jgi:hypothetical protein
MNSRDTASACTHCGRDLDPAWKFCVWCGARVIPDAAAPEPIPHAERHLNPAAVFALVLGILLSPLAIAFGHVALHQLKTSDDRGRLIALIGTVLGYASVVLIVLVVIAWVQLRVPL